MVAKKQPAAVKSFADMPPPPSNLATAADRIAYTSEEIFQKEMQKVFFRQWLFVGGVALLKKPGDYFVKQVGPESMIFMRDKTGTVRAYFNVCRHRGYRMLDDNATGCAEGVVCPYHKWTYDTDGALRRVPGSKNGQDFDFKDYPLHEAEVTTWNGWLFVWLGKEKAPPLSATPGMYDEPGFARIDAEHLKLIHREVYMIDANWKSMMENDLECYHCGHGGHPSLAVACNYQGFYPENYDPNNGVFPLRPGMSTFSMDGKQVSKKLIGADLQPGFNTSFIVYPFFGGVAAFNDHAVGMELTPISVTKSQFLFEWYVHEDAVEGVDYDKKAVVDVFHLTNLEDKHFGERNNQGILSSRFTPGPLHPRRENGVVMGYEAYNKMMAAD